MTNPLPRLVACNCRGRRKGESNRLKGQSCNVLHPGRTEMIRVLDMLTTASRLASKTSTTGVRRAAWRVASESVIPAPTADCASPSVAHIVMAQVLMTYPLLLLLPIIPWPVRRGRLSGSVLCEATNQACLGLLIPGSDPGKSCQKPCFFALHAGWAFVRLPAVPAWSIN